MDGGQTAADAVNSVGHEVTPALPSTPDNNSLVAASPVMTPTNVLTGLLINFSLLPLHSRALVVEPYSQEEQHEKYYQYGYQVEDHYTGDYHGHMEHTAGHLTKGEYKVKLPDGRVQVVSYEADHAGFRPRITYEGISVAGKWDS